jgi:glycosyltransferase involved in cell wall biosynthesis
VLFRPDGGSRARLRELLGRARSDGDPERQPDPDAWSRLEPVGRFVLYFGKLIRQKGVRTLLAAWDRLAPDHPDVALVVVGFGGDREELEALAGERVVFTGAMDHDELAALIPLADAVVVPSVLAEAFGMVAAEAAACGVVPVVSDHSGLAEVAAVLGTAARTFPGPEDSAGELADRLAELLAMPAAERRALGATGRERVAERWSWRSIGDSLLDAAR